MEVASSTTSVSWWEWILFKVVTKTSETRYSLDQYDLDYTMKLYEAISLQEYMESLHQYDNLKRIEEEKMLKKAARMGA